MTQYIQYDEEGNITASIVAHGSVPEHPRQIVLEAVQDIAGKKVDVITAELVEISSTPLLQEE